MTGVRLTAVSKHFGAVAAVEALSLSIAPGEFFSLLGPSGCGKSTTLRLLAGLEAPTAGSVWIDERDVTGVPPHQRDLGMVFQNYALFPHRTVAGNVAYGLEARGVPRAESDTRVAEALARVGLAGYGTRRIDELSGGQQQRVALARALVIRPKLLLLDEPLSNLDAQRRLEMRLELRRLQRELALTVVYVTHDQEEALALSDRLALLRDGRLLAVGSPRALYDDPPDAFTANFLGRANLAAVTVDSREGELATVALPDGQRLGGVAGLPLAVGQSGTLLVRPERLVPASAGLTARLVEVTFNGARYDYELAIAGLRWQASEVYRGQTPPARGALLTWASEPGAARLVRDMETGR